MRERVLSVRDCTGMGWRGLVVARFVSSRKARPPNWHLECPCVRNWGIRISQKRAYSYDLLNISLRIHNAVIGAQAQRKAARKRAAPGARDWLPHAPDWRRARRAALCH